MSRGVMEREVAVALQWKEKDDAVLCAFGRDFFDGARKGAACGGFFTAWLTRRAFVVLKNDYKKYETDLPRHMRGSSLTILRGFRTRPFSTLGCISLGLTTLMKLVKFNLANRRYQEFVADDIGFELLQSMCAGSNEGQERLRELIDEKTLFSDTTAAAILIDECGAGTVDRCDSGHHGTLTDVLVKEARMSSELRAPTFWDGVAVGFLGSIMDCHLPSKPVYCYHGMRCGMHF